MDMRIGSIVVILSALTMNAASADYAELLEDCGGTTNYGLYQEEVSPSVVAEDGSDNEAAGEAMVTETQDQKASSDDVYLATTKE